MHRGEYTVNRSRKDNSFVSFICALLVFLACLILIHVLLVFLGKGSIREQSRTRPADKYGDKQEPIPPNVRIPTTTTYRTRQTQTSGILTTSPTSSQMTTATSKAPQTIRVTPMNHTTTAETEFVMILRKNGSKLFERIIQIESSTISMVANEENVTELVNTTANATTDSTTPTPSINVTKSLTTLPASKTESMPKLYCDNSMCKKNAGKMSYMLSYDVDACSDFYDYACGGQEMPNDGFVDYVKEDVLIYVRNKTRSSKKHLETFDKFYNSCKEYMNVYTFRLAERLRLLKPLQIDGITEFLVEMILTQSMPFFDVGVGISNVTTFQIELTPPGQSTLNNVIADWSLMESIENRCLHEEIGKVVGDQFDMDVIFYATKRCIYAKISDFVLQFAMEMQTFGKIVGERVNLRFIDPLLKLFSVLKDERLPEKSTRVLTIAELITDSQYSFGLDWDRFFRLLKINFHNDTVVIMKNPDYLKKIFGEFKKIESELTRILDLWYQIQLYKNTVVPKHDNADKYCLDFTSQLMPDVTASIIHNLGIGMDLDAFVADIFKTMKSRLAQSFRKSNMTDESFAILNKRLDDLTLWSEDPIADDKLEAFYNDTLMDENVHQLNMKRLVKKYRATVLGLLGTQATPNKLAAYFLNPYDTRPKAFYSTKYIVFHPGFLRRVTNKVPLYVTLAQMGFSLAQELIKFFEKNDYVPAITVRESKLYDSFSNDNPHALEQLINNVSYTFNGHRYLIKASKVLLDKENIIRDDMAFRLVTDWFGELNNTEALVWLNETFTNQEIFLILAAQDYCSRMDMFEFASELYRTHQFPAPMKIKNVMRNSELFLDTFDCHSKNFRTIV